MCLIDKKNDLMLAMKILEKDKIIGKGGASCPTSSHGRRKMLSRHDIVVCAPTLCG